VKKKKLRRLLAAERNVSAATIRDASAKQAAIDSLKLELEQRDLELLTAGFVRIDWLREHTTADATLRTDPGPERPPSRYPVGGPPVRRGVHQTIELPLISFTPDEPVWRLFVRRITQGGN
jgi:hypothetical protein